MSKTSISLSIGSLKFQCEGDAKWTAKRFKDLLGYLKHSDRPDAAFLAAPVAPSIDVVEGDLAEYACDVLVLKHAQGFFGADRDIAKRLGSCASSIGFDAKNFVLQPGEHRLFSSGGAVNSKDILFIGVPPLESFDYNQIELFAEQAIQLASRVASAGVTVAMTIHGVGYGLDEEDAFEAQLRGLRRALSSPRITGRVLKVTIVERDSGRVHRLRRKVDCLGQLGSPAGSDNG